MFRGRSTFVYLVVVLGLVCYLTFIDKRIPGTDERTAEDGRLFKFDQGDVSGLEVDNVHGSFVFQKKVDHWEIVSPVKTPADDPAVNETIGEIASAQPQRTIPLDGGDAANEKNLKEWGLDPAAERAVLHLKDRSLELLVGRKVAINDSVYARTSGRRNAPVRVIPNTVKIVLDKTLSDFRSRNVFDFSPDTVTAVATRIANTATTPAQECEVDLQNGSWMLRKPLVARASGSDVQTLLQHILSLRVAEFITDDPGNLATYGLASPAAVLSISIGDDDQSVLQIGSPVPGKPGQVYAQRLKSNAIFTLEQGAVQELLNDLPNVRDRHVLPFDPAKVTAIDFTVGGGARTIHAILRRESSVWRVAGDFAGAADIGKITDLLTRLQQLQTTPLLKDSASDLTPFGLNHPTGKITLVTTDNKIPTTLTLGKVENGLLYVRNSIEPFIYTVPAAAFDFLGNNLSYRDKRVTGIIPAKVRGLAITVSGEPPLVLDRTQGGTWSAENAKDRMIDTTKADAQVSLLCQLQAQNWLGAPQAAYALDKPVLSFAILTDRPAPTVLRIGAPLPSGGHAAQIQGAADVFDLSDADYGLLNASSLRMIPAALNATNAAPAVPTATNAPPEAPAPAKPHQKKKKNPGTA